MENILSLYIHIPFCLSKCDYCDFFSIKCPQKIQDDYINALCKELLFRKKHFNADKLKTIYIGGGTPSLLSKNQIKVLTSFIKKNFIITDDYEFTFEVNPDDITKELLETLDDCGINRLSCGIQSLSQEVLSFVNRRADNNQNINALETIKKYWNRKLSIDLICGLPFETNDSFLDGLKKILEYNPDHISMYSLVLEEETELYKKIDNLKIEYDFDNTDKMWLEGKSFLQKNGFYQYEVSNFCKSDNFSRHNMAYWQFESYIGCGSGATGTLYNHNNSFRYTNLNDINKYMTFWNKNIEVKIPEDKELLSDKILSFEYFMMGLRTSFGVSRNKYLDFFKTDFPDKFYKIFNEWEKKNLAEKRIVKKEDKIDEIYLLNEDGLLFLNSFLDKLI